MINIDNFEIYAIDFLDNNLSSAEELEFLQFLDKNPELKFEINTLSSCDTLQDNTEFVNKSVLKHNLEEEQISTKNIDEWCIEALEGNLSEHGKNIFTTTINKNPYFKNTWKEYQKTKININKVSLTNKPYKIPNFNNIPQPDEVEYWCVAEIENDLTYNQLQIWEEYKKNFPITNSVYKKINQTKLIVEKCTFPKKHKLKKHKINYLHILSTISVAASIFLFYFLINVNSNTSLSKIPSIANNINNKVDADSSSLANMPNQIIGIYKLAMYIKSQQKSVNHKTISHRPLKINELQPKSLQIENINIKNLSNELKIKENSLTAEELLKIVDNEQQKSNKQYRKTQFRTSNSKNLSLFSVAQAGIKLINKTTGAKMNLKKAKARNRKTKRITFSTKRFSISKRVK